MRILRETWLGDGAQVRAAGDHAEIERLLSTELKKIGEADDGWRLLFQRASDETFWELSYPQSGLQGGGPRLLKQLDLTKPADWK
jgi:hypothetical protein